MSLIEGKLKIASALQLIEERIVNLCKDNRNNQKSNLSCWVNDIILNGFKKVPLAELQSKKLDLILSKMEIVYVLIYLRKLYKSLELDLDSVIEQLKKRSKISFEGKMK